MGKDVCEKKTVLFGYAVAVYIPSFFVGIFLVTLQSLDMSS